ncbi:hypothetical protein VTN96DRAFT_8728 [Rasamsonia emersonii]
MIRTFGIFQVSLIDSLDVWAQGGNRCQAGVRTPRLEKLDYGERSTILFLPLPPCSTLSLELNCNLERRHTKALGYGTYNTSLLIRDQPDRSTFLSYVL